jgi:hypothetical protein
MRTLCCLDRRRSDYPPKQRHMPEDRNPQQHRCKNLRTEVNLQYAHNCLVLVQYPYTNCNAMTAHVCVTQCLLPSPEAQFLPEAVLSCGEPPRLSVAGPSCFTRAMPFQSASLARLSYTIVSSIFKHPFFSV